MSDGITDMARDQERGEAEQKMWLALELEAWIENKGPVIKTQPVTL